MDKMKQLEEKYQQEVINSAYSQGFKCLEKDMSRIEIYESLKSSGYESDLSDQVSLDMMIEIKKKIISKGKVFKRYGLILLVIGTLLFLLPILFELPIIGLPIGIWAIGLIVFLYGLFYQKDTKKIDRMMNTPVSS